MANGALVYYPVANEHTMSKISLLYQAHLMHVVRQSAMA